MQKSVAKQDYLTQKSVDTGVKTQYNVKNLTQREIICYLINQLKTAKLLQ